VRRGPLDADAMTARCRHLDPRGPEERRGQRGAAVLPSRGTGGASMKHLRGDLIALLAVVALALAGQREATATPCKADGQTCRTSRSCCGTSGNNGACVKASGAKFGVCCTPDCTGKACGDDDGCGGSCTCTPPDICVAGRCTGDCTVQCTDGSTITFGCIECATFRRCQTLCDLLCPGPLGCREATCDTPTCG
jgi:hypothetical protein